ncbi:MAG: hypothetical protein IKP06_06690 [Elusimicrobiaceae bacterium]|nr:hypothetical protein [Elusimicrobiaceae bacterium]
MKKPFLYTFFFIFLLTPLVAFGQPKTLEGMGKAATSTDRITSKVTAGVNAGTAAGACNTQRFILPEFHLASPSNLATTLRDSPYKELLNSHTHYTQHNAQAWQALKEIHTFAFSPRTEKGSPYLIGKLKAFVKDPYFMQVMEQNLSAQRYETAMRDLSNFYGLSAEFIPQNLNFPQATTPEQAFVNTTLDFLDQHPHKVSLQLREVLKNPQVRPFKKGINTYIHHSSTLTPQDRENFTDMLHEIYRIHVQSLKQAYQSTDVCVTVSFYNKALSELEDFVKAHNRRPRWDGPLEERQLYNQLMIITHENPFNLFAEALFPLQEINRILAQYPSIMLSWESTLERIEAFIQQNGFYPRSYEKTGGNTTEEELWLLDHVKHHLHANPLLYPRLEQLKIKYNLPLE